jgi:hypothetical protein
LLIANVVHGGGRVTADFDTLSPVAYASGGEVLPRRVDGTAERDSLTAGGSPEAFAASCGRFEETLEWLAGVEAGGLGHGELEERLQLQARELFRLLYQDHLDLRAEREQRIEGVVEADGTSHGSVEHGHQRPLSTVFGRVRVRRLAYRARGRQNLCPADAALNLPIEQHSHGLRRLAAIEAARGSFEDACAATARATGRCIPKRQLEQLARRAAVDFESFYTTGRDLPACEPGDALVLSCDGKGVVMRPDALREQTRRAAATATTKLKTRLSKGEKRNRKRMAEIGAVYDAAPVARAAADVLPTTDAERQTARAGPTATDKWLTASVCDDAATVIGGIFDEAGRRDPEHARAWVALVDGNHHQIARIQAEAKARRITVALVLDFVHVIEYVWKAAWSFFAEGDPTAEQSVHRHLRDILAGKATRVAGNIRRAATTASLDPNQRAGADACAKYLTNKAPFLDYPTALANGWPIATGVIEGACRHLVKDRMDITGARWGLPGAEAVLKLRALVSNGDFDAYWRYHLAQEHRRVHKSRYADATIPQPA